MKPLLTFFALTTFINISAIAQSVVVNPDGTHSTVINNGTTSTIINPDGSHSTVISDGNNRTLINSGGRSVAAANFWNAGEQMIATLKDRAPKHDGVSLRSYSFQDLDNDGKYELMEKINRIEEASTGLLNIELYAAFELVKIYKFKNGKFIECHSGCADYFSTRVHHYQFWKKQIVNPINLSTDSRALIKNNKPLFISELNRRRITGLSAPQRSVLSAKFGMGTLTRRTPVFSSPSDILDGSCVIELYFFPGPTSEKRPT